MSHPDTLGTFNNRINIIFEDLKIEMTVGVKHMHITHNL